MAEDEPGTVDRQLAGVGRLTGLERLIAGTAHEINNPLTSVAGLASLLLMDTDDPQAREDLEIMIAETERAIVIVRNLRAFVPRGAPERQPCDLNQAVSLVSLTRGYELRARGIESELTLGSGLPPVTAAYDDLLHLVLQLILDAEDSLLGPHSAVNGAATEDVRPGGVVLHLATSAIGADAVLTATHECRHLRAPAGRSADIGRAMARMLGGTLSVDRLPDGRVRTTVVLPGVA
jgi:nitrogen-specific signal transduction histidine kinase